MIQFHKTHTPQRDTQRDTQRGSPRGQSRGRSRGFSMIEVLVTLLIVSLALLGTAGLQAYSMRLNQGGQFRTQAVFLVADLAERIEANKAGPVGAANYVLAASGVASAPNADCQVGACAPAALATFDLLQWQNAVFATLPQSSWEVCVDADLNGVCDGAPVITNPINYLIRIGWVDRRVDTTNAAFDATTQLGSNATGTGERFFYTATRTVLK